jgi:hypothetical protein
VAAPRNYVSAGEISWRSCHEIPRPATVQHPYLPPYSPVAPREPNLPEETPHRHTFSARFEPTRITPSTIVGDVTGRTQAVISTGTVKEDQHFHDIEGTGVVLDALILSGTENNVPGEHKHLVSIE